MLSQVSQPAIIPHMAEFEGKRFPYEVRPGVKHHFVVAMWLADARVRTELGHATAFR